MTDFEITKLCAEAMGWDVYEINPGIWRVRIGVETVMGLTDDFCRTRYDPLHDDAQAMALVKKFAKAIVRRKEGDWSINLDGARNADLNRAICECVAKMQKTKG